MKTPRKTGRLAGRLLICAALLVWIFHVIFVQEGRLAVESQGTDWDSLTRSEQFSAAWTQGPPAVWGAISAVAPGAYALSLLFMGATLLIGARRWQLALVEQGLNLPFPRALEITLIAHFFNSFLLGSTGGDLLKAYYAARETHHKKTEAVTTVFVDRLIGLFSMLLFAVALAAPNAALIRGHDLTGLVFLTVLGMFVACGILVYAAFWGRNSGEDSLFGRWLKRLPRGEYLERSLISCRIYGNRRSFLLKSLALSTLLNLCCALQFHTLAVGLELGVSFTLLLFLAPAIICISALPITPSGLGVREHLFVGALTATAVGAPAKLALSLSLLAYSGWLAWSVIGGLVYVNLKEARHLDEVATATD